MVCPYIYTHTLALVAYFPFHLQSLTGISATDFQATPSIAVAFRTTVASTMTGVNVDAVTITGVSDARRRLDFSPERILSAFSLQSSTAVSYEVAVVAESLGYSDPQAAYTALSGQLTASVTSGGFSSALATTRYACMHAACFRMYAVCMHICMCRHVGRYSCMNACASVFVCNMFFTATFACPRTRLSLRRIWS